MSIQRKIFIHELFQFLNDKEYLLLKFTESSLDEIGEYSDLDILLPQRNWEEIKLFAECKSIVTKVSCQKQSTMCQLFLQFSDGGFLQIDCLFKLIRKNLVYLSNEYLLSNQILKNEVKTYSTFCLFEHLVAFNQLNHSGLPKKYIQFFQNLPQQELNEILEKFHQKYYYKITTLLQVSEFNFSLQIQLKKIAKSLDNNQGISKIANTSMYVVDSVVNLKRQRGFLISFSGVDGAGKSTILEATRRLLSEKFRKKTVVIRHRPSLLPILSSYKYGKANAEKRAATRLPRQGKNKSQFKSLLRFAYYYTDYLIGRSYIFCKYQLRNYIVLYDRYYFDFIVDGKRTNLELDTFLPKQLYRFVQKPELNFFLYAPAETILARKKELSSEAINSLTAKYKNLFDELEEEYPQHYYSIKNIHLNETLDFISKQIKEII